MDDVPSRRLQPAAIRSRMILELASELVGSSAWPYTQAKISMGELGADAWSFVLLGGDSPQAIGEIARGALHEALINPAMVLTLAIRGTGPFKEPIPLRIITNIPEYDQLGFAVTERTGLSSLEEIRERHFPLRVSLRGERPDHAVHLVVDEVLAAAGFSLDDIVAWGGEVRYDPGMPDGSNRLGAVERGEIDAIFDEAVIQFANRIPELGMRFLPLGETLLKKLEVMGFRRGTIEKARYPNLPADVVTMDFSDFPLYTHASVPDEVITAICAALVARRDRIPWGRDEEAPLPLERMCLDSPDTPLVAPLHPAAEQFWRQCGYL